MRHGTWIVVAKDATGSTIDRAEFDRSNSYGQAPMDVAYSYARTMLAQARNGRRGHPAYADFAGVSYVRTFAREWPNSTGESFFTED